MDIMLDLETLGTGPDARILTIGVAAFSVDAGVVDFAEIAVDDPDGVIDFDTAKWWQGQSAEAQAAAFTDQRVPLREGLLWFAAFVRKHEGARLWSNGPTFDEIILRAAWKRAAMPQAFPVHFAKSRCCRTVFEIMRKRGIVPPEPLPSMTTSHRASHDAARQALSVVATLREL